MDKRLEKIRHFQANVKDFESYINDRIKQTKSENGKNVNESINDKQPYQEYGLEPSENISEECLNYIVTNIEDFGVKYNLALKKTNRMRCSLRYADSYLFDKIFDLANEWRYDNDLEECNVEDIEEIFG